MSESAHPQHDNSPKKSARQKQPSAPLSAASALEVLQRAQNAPQTLRPVDVLQLQRTIGNRAIGRLLQAKLKLGPAGDRYEPEADRVARKVVINNQIYDPTTELQVKGKASDLTRVNDGIYEGTVDGVNYMFTQSDAVPYTIPA
jgi:hypothetical protein